MNRNFLVTGGAQGIGLAYCRTILAGGGKVFLTDINEVQGEEASQSLAKEFGGDRVAFQKQDVTDSAAWPVVWDAADAFFSPGKVEALCNNAGIFSKTAWQRVVDINLCGLVTGTMLAIERMGASRGGPGGLIVQTASMASFLAGFDTIEESMYTCTKQGVLGLVRSMAVDKCYPVERVRMVGISPLFVNTELVRTQVEAGNDTVANRYKTRLLEPSEIGEAFKQLVTGGLSGQMLVVFPGFCFYWPDWNRSMVKLFGLACSFQTKVLGQGASEPISPQQLAKLGLIMVVFLFSLFHIFLNYIGL